MPVTFVIPGPLRQFTGGQARVELDHSHGILADVLLGLNKRCPGIRDRILNEQGQLREHINIFVGDENIRYTGGLATVIPANCEVSIVPAISGG